MNSQTTDSNRSYLIYFLITVILFLLGRSVGFLLFENNWSFTHWKFTDTLYIIVWILLSTTLLFIFCKKTTSVEKLAQNKTVTIVSSIILFLLFFIFQFDSFIFSGGNYRINQIAQVDTIIYRFYEFGTILLVSLFYKFYSLFEMHYNEAGYFSWKTVSYIGTLLTFIASLLISKRIDTEKNKRILLFIIIFFGPQALLYFGFIGTEPLIPAFLYFFIYNTIRFEQEKNKIYLIWLWLVTCIAVFFHISFVLLAPALLFVTIKAFIKKKSLIPFVVGLILYIGILVTVFVLSARNFAFSKQILFLNDFNLNRGYNLFSLNHIGDVFQLVLLFFPQVIAFKLLFFRNTDTIFKSISLQALLLLTISCNTLVIILEATHSIILDSIGMAVLLSPMAVFLALLIKDHLNALRLFAAAAIITPFAVFPVYTSIEKAEPYVADYLTKNHQFYIEAGTSIQDSYFYQKKIDEANYWYTNMKKLSRDFLDLTAAGEYTIAEMYPEALRLLYQLKNRYQYWTEPRYQIATVQLKLKRFNLAKPEIDSCLYLEPYRKDFLKLSYAYYRDLGNFPKALDEVIRTIEIYPEDFDIQTDQAIILYRLKDINAADSVAEYVIANDSTQAYAYLIRGFIAEINKNPRQAISYFESFINYGRSEPEAPEIRKRLNDLILQQRESNN